MDIPVLTYLTNGEAEVLELLREAHERFIRLEEHRPSDLDEWTCDIHRLQYRIMARAAIRAYPDKFNPLERKQ